MKSVEVNGQIYSICADLDSSEQSEEVFFARESDGERYISLSDILSDHYGSIYKCLTDTRQKRFDEIRTNFRNYPFSFTLVEYGDLDILCDLFERINNTGVELSVFDLLVARTWSPDDDHEGFDLRASYTELRNELDNVDFSDIPEPVIAQLAGAIIKNACTRKAILSIGRQEMREMWNDLTKSLRHAVDFTRKTLRIKTSRLLPYPSLLVSLAYFFYRNGMQYPDGNQSLWLMRYFYLNGLSWRLSSGTQSKLTDDLHIIDRCVDGDFARFDITVGVTPEDIRNTQLSVGSAYCKSLLCLLSARSPLDFRDGSEVELQGRFLQRANSRQFHHVFPKAYMRGRAGAEEVNTIANVALIPADLNLRIGKQAPSRYFAPLRDANSNWSSTIESQAIENTAEDALFLDDFVRFVECRSETLSRLAIEAIGENQ